MVDALQRRFIGRLLDFGQRLAHAERIALELLSCRDLQPTRATEWTRRVVDPVGQDGLDPHLIANTAGHD